MRVFCSHDSSFLYWLAKLLGEYEDEGKGRAGEPMSKAEALQEAKRWLREHTDESGHTPYEHPYYWSAFVLIGNRS